MFVFLLVSLLFTPVIAKSETAYIVADRDNTLIESLDPENVPSNGSGPYLFAGRTNQGVNNLRRGLIHFDVGSALPPDARIKSAKLMIYLSKSQESIAEISLHRVLNDWGQGGSNATGGKGAPAEPNDATWLHTFYPNTSWLNEGGDYVMLSSASLDVGPDNGSYTWESRQMNNDVQSWVDTPGENFGWMLIGDENTSQSVMGFASREVTCSDKALSTELPPILMVTYK
jgi:hypothetical protein